MVDVPRVRGEHLAPRTILRCQGHQGIEHIGGPGLVQQFPGTPRERPIGLDDLSSGEHPRQTGLARSSPSLGDYGGGNHWSLPSAMGLREQCPGVAIPSVEGDECSGVEHLHPAGGVRRPAGGCQAVRVLAAAMSSSVIGPASASYSAMAAARRSRPRRSAAAWAIQELTPPRPARARTSFTRSPGSVTVNLGISRFIHASMTQVLPCGGPSEASSGSSGTFPRLVPSLDCALPPRPSP